MEKMIIFHRLTNENFRPIMERWFRKEHAPDVLVQTPWTLRYLLYRACPPPPGAHEMFGTYDYRIHESWAPNIRERRGTKGLLGMAPDPVPTAIQAQIVYVPAEPTEDFLGQDIQLEEHSILRWVTAFHYPEGADKKACDDWYLNVHVPEVMKQPGLIRFFSHKCVAFEGSLLPITTSDNNQALEKMGWPRHWDRLSEMWYENNDGWVDSVITNPPQYTKPDWATADEYPFLAPEQDFISTFLLESPEYDMAKMFRQAYY